MSRLTVTLLAVSTTFAAALPLAAQQPAAPAAPAAIAPPAAPRARTSPHETVGAVIDGARVTITYGRPFSAKGGQGEKRKIWGGLVPYGKVWRTGSDEATLLVVEKPVTIGGAEIPAGAYTLWTLPAADGSAKLIINKQVGQWGIDRSGNALRDEKQDLAVVDLKKDTLSSTVDQFTIAVTGSRSGGGEIKLAWEDTQYSVAVAGKK
jgi:hypothetical protein